MRFVFRIITVATFALPSVAVADSPGSPEEFIAQYSWAVEPCWRRATTDTARRSCMGLLADACIDAESPRLSRLSISLCGAAEALWWEQQLNHELARLNPVLWSQDQAGKDYGDDGRLHALNRVSRSWKETRDARCDLHSAIIGPSSAAERERPFCMAEETLEQVIYLIGIREQVER